MKEISHIKKAPKHEKNPFHKELLEDFQVVSKRDWVSPIGDRSVQNLVINADGEKVGESRFYKLKRYDTEQFTKIFIKKISAIWDMPNTAQRVFSYILTQLQKGEDQVYFDFKEAMKFTEYKSDRSIWEGVKWLMENEFIAKSQRMNFYFINPTIFFNGDRVAFVDMIVRERKSMPGQLDAFNPGNIEE